MARPEKKLTPEQKAAKKKWREEHMTIFVNGKQKHVKRPPTIDGMLVEDFILQNADPIWLHQNGMWQYIDQNGDPDVPSEGYPDKPSEESLDDDCDIPF